MDQKIILFELNEVPFRIIDQYCRWHPQSALARHLPECSQYETYAPDKGHLSPWKTWPTVHRGVSNERHLIGDFGQDLKETDKEFPPLWDLLCRGGVRTGVCGSLHTYPLPDEVRNYAFYLPDTFAAGSECFPDKLSLFQDFNLTMARESARNVSTRVPWQAALRMLRASPELGFKAKTFIDLGKQLVSERMRSWQKSRRRTYQAVLAFDVFMKQLSETRPDFCTFFTNHVAAAQHRFWAAAFPEDFENLGYEAKWVDTYSHEIQFAMEKFDAFFARLVSFVDANRDYVLWITTSMGQQANEAKALETQLYLTDSKKFTEAMGLSASDWEIRPAMLPQWNALIRDHKIPAFRESLAKFEIDGVPLTFREAAGGFFSLDFGQQNLYDRTVPVKLGDRSFTFEQMGLKNVEIEDKSGASGYHMPQGAMLIFDPNNRSPKTGKRSQMATTEIAPTLLKNFSVPIPDYMSQPVTLSR